MCREPLQHEPGCRSNGIPKLVQLLRCPDLAVAASAAGALQNIAREVASRLILCDTDCPAALADLVASGDAQAQVRRLLHALLRRLRVRILPGAAALCTCLFLCHHIQLDWCDGSEYDEAGKCSHVWNM